jgi:16S rRNA (guanine(966)-N(2))-methyltransferase RsmD
MRLKCPPGDAVRPIPDMAREAIFNILRDATPEATVLDLFAGSGAMGIEALSRGAGWCVFVERSARVRRVLESNLAHTRLAELSDVLQRDALKCTAPLQRLGRTFDLVFVGPPFALMRETRGRRALRSLLGALASAGLLNPGARLILQHERQSHMHETPGGLTLEARRAYGRNLFNFYSPGHGVE